MRKSSFYLFFLAVICISCQCRTAAAQEAAQDSLKYTHWSLELKGGLSTLRGGSRDTAGAVILSGKPRIAAGLTLEYTFNPLWGLAVEYMYADYSNWGFDARSHEGALIGEVNLSNLLAPRRSGCSRQVNVYGHIGGGLSFYAYERQGVAPAQKRSGTTTVMPMGMSAEWNISKTLALNLRGEYRWHSGTNMLGIPPFEPGYGFWAGTGGIRVKFGGARHIRNITWGDYTRMADKALLDTLLQERQDQMQDRMKSLLQEYQSQHLRDNEAYRAEIGALQEALAAVRDSCRNMQQAAPGPATFTLTAVHFSTGEYRLSPSDKSYLSALAALLKQQEQWLLSVSGHTDNTGTETRNKTLSDDRAEAVRTFLAGKGISTARVAISSAGSAQPAADNNTPEGRRKNRRAEIQLLIR